MLFESNLRSNLTSMAAEAVWRSPWPQRLPIGHKMQMDIRVIDDADVKYQGIFAIRDHFLANIQCSRVYRAIAL